MHHALIWLLVIEILGLIALPLSFKLFGRLPDRGLILSKVLGLLLGSYILWLLGLTRVVPNSQYTIVVILVALAAVSSLVMWRSRGEIASFLRRERVPLLTGELVFLGFYFLWLSVVAFSPAINHTEKPMDFAFLNAVLMSDHFPPEDPWLAGHSISYYYFGHFMMAFLTKLTAIPSSVSYNLSIALIAALVAGGAFSLVYNLIRLSGALMRTAVLFALAAPVFILLIGNLEGVFELVHAQGWGSQGFWEWVSVKGLEGTDQGSALGIFPGEHWWWWRATRVIDTVVDGVSLDYTITEFPFFSFLLGDLHAHVSALPFVLLNLALGLNLFISRERLGFAWIRHHPWETFAMALSLGALAFINLWDFPIVAALLVVLVLVKGCADWGGRVERALLPSVTLLVPVLAGAVLLYIPFYLSFSSQAGGILPQGEQSTRPLFFFVIWGLFLVISGSFLLRQLPMVPGLKDRNPGLLATVVVITLLPFLLWAGLELIALWIGWGSLVDRLGGRIIQDVGTVGTRFGMLLPGLAVVGLAAYSALLRARHDAERATTFPIVVLALTFYLLVGVELFYLVDLFGNRMNTVFKAYYEGWLLLAVVSAYGLYYVSSRPVPSLGVPAARLERAKLPLRVARRTVGYGWVGVVVVLILASLYYPVGAAFDRWRGTGEDSFDGLDFLRSGVPDEYEAIIWLRDEAPRGRIVEAVGKDAARDNDYSEYGRISSSTGLPTILGWKSHEHQWRGSRRAFEGREEQVRRIYLSRDAGELVELLDEYDIRYVFVGAREREAYGGGQFDKFPWLLQPVFESRSVVIYERVQEGDRPAVERDDGGTG